jgi:UDP-2,3-diacylglucosamine pyrophosphatase LpxH
MQYLVIGDLHLQERNPKKEQTLRTLHWIENLIQNNNETILILLGDLVESINSVPELLEIYFDLFLNKYKFKEIWILRNSIFYSFNIQTY